MNQLSFSELRSFVIKEFEKNNYLDLEYFEIAEATSLETEEIKKENTSYRAFIACFISGVRLIDNIALN